MKIFGLPRHKTPQIIAGLRVFLTKRDQKFTRKKRVRIFAVSLKNSPTPKGRRVQHKGKLSGQNKASLTAQYIGPPPLPSKVA